MTHEYLDHSNVDLVLEKMGGEAVPERMQGHRLADASRLPGVMEGPAELAGGEWIDRLLAGEQPAPGQHHPPFVPGPPPGAKQIEQGGRQHGIAVLAPLALLDRITSRSLLMSVSLSETTSAARKPVP